MDRQKAPVLILPDHLDLIFPEKIILENGVELYWLKDVKDESVKLDIEWSAGSRYQKDKLSASFASRMLLSGTGKKSAKQIAEEIDYFGGFYSLSSDYDYGGITLYGLNHQISAIFDLFADAFRGACFHQYEFEKERDIALEHYRIDQEKVKVICRKNFSKALYGETSPYGTMAVESDFLSLNPKALSEFHETFYLGTRPTLFLVGRTGPDFIEQLRRWSAEFPNHIPVNKLNHESQATGEIRIAHKNAVQSAIRIGRRLIGKEHPDYFVFQVLNTILGGYFGSRLMANIREDKGYTYGIGSGVAVMTDEAYFFISTETGGEFREKVIEEIFREIEILKNEMVSVAELGKVRNYLLGEFLRQADSPIPMMECFKNLWYHDLSRTYYDDFIRAVGDCTPENIREVAGKYLKREEMVAVVAG